TSAVADSKSRDLGRQGRHRHRTELHALGLLQQLELLEIDGSGARIRARSRFLLIRLRLFLRFAPAEIFGQALLRLAAHDLVARLGGAIGERREYGSRYERGTA